MRAGSLFTGTGALDMAAGEVFGAEQAWFCDLDPATLALLAHHYPDVPNLGDITRVGLPYSDEEWAAMQARAAEDEDYELPMPDWSVVEPVEVLTGGFPCQDISNAGKREGITGARSGLWSYYADAIRALRPRYVLVENVGALVVRGLDRVLADLATLGFDAEWAAVRASDVGAPHQRERIFIAAAAQNPDSAARGERREPAPGQEEGRRSRSDARGRGGAPAADADRDRVREQPESLAGRCGQAVAEQPVADAVADADRDGRELLERGEPGVGAWDHTDRRSQVGWAGYAPVILRWERITGRQAPAPTVLSVQYQKMLRRRLAGVDRRPVGMRGSLRHVYVLNPALPEWMMGLPDGWITTVPGLSRAAQLKLAGNGVVPQQAIAAFRYLLDLLDLDARNAA